MRRLVAFALLCACGPQPAALKFGVYTFEGLRGREGAVSAAVTGSKIEVDTIGHELKLTVSSATRKFGLSRDSTKTPGCGGTSVQDTRTLDAPNLQLGEFLIDSPLLHADCPPGSGVVILQQGPLGSEGAAPMCSADILCFSFKLAN